LFVTALAPGIKGKLRSAISGVDPVKGRAANREICRGEAFGAEFSQKVRNICPNASPLPIVPPTAKIMHKSDPGNSPMLNILSQQ
jgi:hypothetical protein